MKNVGNPIEQPLPLCLCLFERGKGVTKLKLIDFMGLNCFAFKLNVDPTLTIYIMFLATSEFVTDAKFRTGKLTIAENLLLNLIKRGKACVIPRLSTNTATFS